MPNNISILIIPINTAAVTFIGRLAIFFVIQYTLLYNKYIEDDCRNRGVTVAIRHTVGESCKPAHGSSSFIYSYSKLIKHKIFTAISIDIQLAVNVLDVTQHISYTNSRGSGIGGFGPAKGCVASNFFAQISYSCTRWSSKFILPLKSSAVSIKE